MVTDAWFPQVNGVVRTLATTRDELVRLGHEVEVISPDRFFTVPCPTYPQIRLALGSAATLPGMIEAFGPSAVHIATEGPLGRSARRWCLNRGLPFTTAYHTRFPEYVHARFRVPTAWMYALLRNFHSRARGTMVATPTVSRELEARGFRNLRRWTRGVDTDLFRPRDEAGTTADPYAGLPRPVFLSVGRVAIEKNLPAFLDLDLPGTKVVIGDGPDRGMLCARYPEIRFLGEKKGEDLARHFSAADSFVFPSRTDTFGLVMLEAMASGLPVAAHPVPGPLDVLTDPQVGVLDEDLRSAAMATLSLDRTACRTFALDFSWEASTRQFLSNLAEFDSAGLFRRGRPSLATWLGVPNRRA